MNNEELFALVKRVDPRAVRLPPGLIAIAAEIEMAERDRICVAIKGGSMSHLPPLPEPHRMLGNDVYGKEYPCYTESDMLALRAATVEACAAKVETLFLTSTLALIMQGIATEIRNLLTKES